MNHFTTILDALTPALPWQRAHFMRYGRMWTESKTERGAIVVLGPSQATTPDYYAPAASVLEKLDYTPRAPPLLFAVADLKTGPLEAAFGHKRIERALKEAMGGDWNGVFVTAATEVVEFGGVRTLVLAAPTWRALVDSKASREV